MSEENKPAQPAAVAAPGSPIHINVAPPSEGKAKPSEPAQADAKEAAERVKEKAQRQLLKQMGVPKDERDGLLAEIQAGRKKLADLTKQAADSKAQVEALKPAIDRVTQLEAELKQRDEILKGYADREYEALPEALQKTLIDMKIEEPRARLDMINIWRKNGLITPAQAAAAAADVKAAPKPAAPSTTMANAGPAAPKPAGTLNHYEQWKSLKDSGQQFVAAQFYNRHSRIIEEQRPK